MGIPETGRSAPERSFISHNDIARFVKRYFWTIATSVLATLSAAILYLLTTTPIYTARTQILIDPKIPQVLRQQTGDAVFALDSAQVESEIAVLRSEKIATSVIEQLHLLNDPEFIGDDAETTAKQATPTANKKGAAGETPQKTPANFVTMRRAMSQLEGNLDVRRAGLSYAMDVYYSSRDPEKAAKIANAMAETYIRDQLTTRAEAAAQGSQWLEGRIDQLRKQMNDAALMVQEFRARRDYRFVPKRETPAQGPAAQQGQQNQGNAAEGTRKEANTLEELESTAATYRKIYESFLQAYTESVQRQSYPVSNARIITPATRPLTKSYPRTTLVLAFAIVAGLLAGTGISLIRHSLDRSVRQSREIREEIGLECLGQIPRIGMMVSEPILLRLKRFLLSLVRKPEQPSPAGGYREVLDAPFSRFSDGLRAVKASVALASKTRPMRSIGITSALPREGKSTIASNLAALYSVAGTKTLLVDADVRNSSLSRELAPHATSGLVDILTDGIDAKSAIVRIDGAGLDLLPASGERQVLDSSSLLGSHELKQLLTELQKSYDIIVVDMPPIEPLVDGLALGSQLDGVIILAEWGETPLPLLADTVHSLRKSHAKILGAVLTKVAMHVSQLAGYRARGYTLQ
jgi:capsular exopolysaccharide synthesis family protein